ncbi:MAG: hypothetical protein HYY00_00990 [Chloroflexi bacterium]|nr:hypothetical protein [Chloroflexota bacterium]
MLHRFIEGLSEALSRGDFQLYLSGVQTGFQPGVPTKAEALRDYQEALRVHDGALLG